MASSSNPNQQQPINYSADAIATSTVSTIPKGPVPFDEDLFLFLPRLGDILKSFDKTPNELKTKIDELRKQFEASQEMVSRLEGIDTTMDDQRIELERLDLELKSKTELLKKHIQMCKFDLNMPPKRQPVNSDIEDGTLPDSGENLTHPMNINDDENEEQDVEDEEDDDLFQSDEQNHDHPQGNNEMMSPFFS